MNKLDYYTFDKINQYQSDFKIVFGSRGCGKSYSAKKMIIDNFFKSDGKEEFVIVRRYAEDTKTKVMQTYFNDMADYLADNYHAKVKFYQGQFYVKDLEDDDSGIKGAKVMGYVMAVALSERYKSTSYPNVTTIVFEEFMSLNNKYIDGEIGLFNNLCSTIIRKRTNVNVYLLGNAISTFSPYTDELHLDIASLPIDSITPIDKYEGLNRYRYIVERTKNVKVDVNQDYFYQYADSSKSTNMITEGQFELPNAKLSYGGVSGDDLEPYGGYYRFYLKVTDRYYLLGHGVVKELEEINTELYEWDFYSQSWVLKGEGYEWDWLTDEWVGRGEGMLPTSMFTDLDEEDYNNLYHIEPEPFNVINKERVLGFFECESPIGYPCDNHIIILNDSNHYSGVDTFAKYPTNHRKVDMVLNDVFNALNQDKLIFDSYLTASNVLYGLNRIK